MKTETIVAGFSIAKREPFPAGANPFDHDYYNMGTKIGRDLMIMYDCHSNEETEYVILVHMPTGQRVRVFTPDPMTTDD